MALRGTRPRGWQDLGYALGAGAGLLGLAVLLAPASERLHARGAMNSGHEDMDCVYCHRDAPGSYRQQIQAGLRYLAGRRATPADFGRRNVDNEACMACHERPDDRHPVYRFLEPRFADARRSLRPQLCESCHLEHSGRRVTLADTGYCVNCHEDTRVRKDPLDVPHEDLIGAKRWETCLGCHDFHGNHIMTTATMLDQAESPQHIRAYFEGGPSPYGEQRRHEARREPGP